MTAVDRAELKRLAEGAISSLNSGLTVKQIEAAAVAFDVAANPAVVLELLSEIEGLKAERGETEKRTSEYFVGMREATDNAAIYKHDKLEAERQLAALRTQAPDSWRPIETAPKDGTRFIAYGLWMPTWKEAEPHVEVMWRYDDDEYCEAIGGKATHWMPLPAAPALRPQTAESGK